MKKLIVICILSVFFFSCGKSDKSGNTGNLQLNGAGATFPYPVYSKWFDEYSKINKDAKINYQSIGSGGGIKQITEGTVDFGATDAPMKDEEIKNAETKNFSKVIQIPTVLGAVVVCYNLPGVDKTLKLSPETLTGILLGKIKKWNDAKIMAENLDSKLPEKDITVISRADGSGTTFVFTDFLGKVSEEWKNGPGTGKEVKFPVGQSAKGNEGVTGMIKQNEYSIGYVELIYALQNKLKYASIKNANGDFVDASLESVTKAAEVSVDKMPESLTMSITNAAGPGAYPISSYTYLIVYENQKDEAKGKILKAFLKWALTDGEKIAKDLQYSPLPDAVVKKALAKVETIKLNGK